MRFTATFPPDTRLTSSLSVISLGRIPRTTVVERYFEVCRQDKSDLLFESVKSNNPCFQVSRINRGAVDDVRSAYMVLRVDPAQMPLGRFNEPIVIRTSPHEHDEINVSVQGEVTTDAIADPGDLFLDRVPAASSQHWRVRIMSQTNRHFSIKEVTHTLGSAWNLSPEADSLNLSYAGSKSLKPSPWIRGEIEAMIAVEGVQGLEHVKVPVHGILTSP